MRMKVGTQLVIALLCTGGYLTSETAKASPITISEIMQGSVTEVFITGPYDPKSIEVGNRFIFSYTYTYTPETGPVFDYTLELFSDSVFYAAGTGLDTHHIYSSDFGLTWNQSGEFTTDPNGTYRESDDGDNNFTFFALAVLPGWDAGGTGENMISVTFGSSMWAACSFFGSAFNLDTGEEVASQFTLRLEAQPAPAPTPEPATLLLFSAGLAGMIRTGKRHGKRLDPQLGG